MPFNAEHFDGAVLCTDGGWVADCWCGPHEDCPEHFLNCLSDPEDWDVSLDPARSEQSRFDADQRAGMDEDLEGLA